MTDSVFIPISINDPILFPLWLSNIPIFHCIYVPYLHPFICPWTFRLLPCLAYCKYCCNGHKGACVFLNYDFSQGRCPVVDLLGHRIILFLVFKGTSILFSIMAVSIYNPTNSAKGFSFLHILSSICINNLQNF